MVTQSNTLSSGRLFAIGCIFAAVSFAWLIFGKVLSERNSTSSNTAKSNVTQLWGPAQSQQHPKIWSSLNINSRNRSYIQPISSIIDVKLNYEPKKKGLIWNNTYTADFAANYQIKNSTDESALYHISFALPSINSSYHDFVFQINGTAMDNIIPSLGEIKQTISIPANETADLRISYRSRGMDQWSYHLGDTERIKNFRLNMETNFENVDFPVGSSSPTSRDYDGSSNTSKLTWNYPDVIRPQHIAMQIPEIKDAGLIASKVSFFAPVSLLFFFAIMVIFGLIKGTNLHPMNYVFMAAGFFSFHLLFAYLANLVPLHLAFVIAASVSLALIGSYIKAIGGKKLMKIAIPAQFTYLVLFSYSFLFNGATGITIAIGSIITLALVMRATTGVDWAEVFTTSLLCQKTSSRAVPSKEAETPIP